MNIPIPTLVELNAERVGVRHIGSAWVLRHYRACCEPTEKVELPLLLMIEGLMRYFNANPELTKDYVLYPAFCEALGGVRSLLNGDTGRLDCGVLDEMLYRMSEEHTSELTQSEDPEDA